MDGDGWFVCPVHDLVNVSLGRIYVADIAGQGASHRNGFQALIGDSKPTFFFFAFKLTDHPPGAVVVYRRTLSWIPYKRDHGERTIRGTVEQILCIGLGSNGPPIWNLQPIRLPNQIAKMRCDGFDNLGWWTEFADARLDGVEEVFELSVHSFYCRAPSK